MTEYEIPTLHHRRCAATRSALQPVCLPLYLTQPRECRPGSSLMMMMIIQVRSAGRHSVTGTLITTPQWLFEGLMLSESSPCEAARVAFFCFSAGLSLTFDPKHTRRLSARRQHVLPGLWWIKVDDTANMHSSSVRLELEAQPVYSEKNILDQPAQALLYGLLNHKASNCLQETCV